MFQGFKNDHASAKYGPLQKLPGKSGAGGDRMCGLLLL